MGRVQFWLAQGKTRFQFPVNPESLPVSSPFEYEDTKITRLGEFGIPQERGLKEFTINSFFPVSYNPVYCETSKVKQPSEYVKLIERWRDSRKPMYLSVTGANVGFYVTIREFTYDYEKAGNPGDIYFSITFKEHRHASVRSLVPKKKGAGQKPVKKASRISTKSTPKTYTVKSGDSLWKIAQKQLGNGSRLKEIYELNKKVIGPNPNLIKPGQKLVLPS